MLNLIMQTQGTASGGLMSTLLLFGPLILIFYFLLWRPQSQRMKAHRKMIEELSRGDNIVTNGGLMGKITKVGEADVTIQIAEGVRVKIVKNMIADVQGKPEPANDTKKK